MKRVIFLFSLSVFAASCSTVRMSPNFQKRSAEIRTVAVADPDVSIQLMVFKGDNKPLFEESKAAVKTTKGAVIEEFKKRGYEVKPLVLTEKMIAENPDLPSELSKLKERYAALAQDVQKQYVSKMEWNNFKLSLGSDVNQFADLVGADALVFVTGTGFRKSGGEIANDVAKSVLIAAASLGSLVVVYPSAAGTMDISIVDADNGDILWHNFSDRNRAYDFTKENALQGMVKQMLRLYPKRKALPKISEKPKIEEREEIEGRRVRVSPPVEAVKITAKTGAAVGETTADVAEDILKGTVKIGSAAPKAMVNLLTLGATESRKGDADAAIKAYKQAVEVDKENPYPYLLLGDAYLKKGDLENAEKNVRKSIELDPSIPESQRVLSDLLSRKKKIRTVTPGARTEPSSY